jgi:hypothetical protein
MKNEEKRSFLHALFLHIGIRIRYLFDSKFFLAPLLGEVSAYPSPFRPKHAPKLDFLTLMGIKFFWIFSGMVRQYKPIAFLFLVTGIYHLLGFLHRKLMARVVRIMQSDPQYLKEGRERPIPEYDWQNGSPEEFYETFVKRPHPVVLRGFMDNSDLVRELTYDKILEKYGEEDVLLTRKEMDGYPGKVKDVEDPSVYLHNAEVFFNKYPEFNEYLETERLEPYARQKVGYSQLFVGRHGTGTPFHNAGVFNYFYMVDGSKTWEFIDPYDTPLMYPMWGFGTAASFSCCLFTDEFDEQAFPAFQYCPYYKATLNPGDVLFNPPWWWHAIRNVSEKTVGIASRWHTDGIAGHKFTMTEEDYDIHRFASFQFFMGLKSFPFLQSILREPSPKFDEHKTVREKNNRFVHKQREIAESPGLVLFGHRITF